MAVEHKLQRISDIADLRISEDEVAEVQEEIDLIFEPNTDPLDISKELRVRAEEELRETSEKMRENLITLRQMVLAEKNLHARTDDIFLEPTTFLSVIGVICYSNRLRLKNYYQFKASYPHFYTYTTPSENSYLYDMAHFSSLPGVDRKGRRMCALFAARMDLDKSPLDETFQLGTTVFEIMLQDPHLQITGTVAILDLKDLTLYQQARLATPTCAWHLANIVQDKIPLRLKAVHVVNQPFYFNAIYAVFKPFLKKKLRKRIFLHGTDFDSLHKHVDPEGLPAEWNGKRGPFTNRATRAIIKMNEHKFKEWKQFTYREEN
ncbi:clavesin-2 [Nilaparvata lugens]|uniref:clavesin-2 n=1 Tax=Nilaparvata lugens TaxID=108931 RepID=UPI00193E8FBB|nr:clavesin-2 [Nilaparvata lugens]